MPTAWISRTVTGTPVQVRIGLITPPAPVDELHEAFHTMVVTDGNVAPSGPRTEECRYV
jgi:hypothetical protein